MTSGRSSRCLSRMGRCFTLHLYYDFIANTSSNAARQYCLRAFRVVPALITPLAQPRDRFCPTKRAPPDYWQVKSPANGCSESGNLEPGDQPAFRALRKLTRWRFTSISSMLSRWLSMNDFRLPLEEPSFSGRSNNRKSRPINGLYETSFTYDISEDLAPRHGDNWPNERKRQNAHGHITNFTRWFLFNKFLLNLNHYYRVIFHRSMHSHRVWRS